MAKVYDALKRVEAERSRQLAARPPAPAAPERRIPLWWRLSLRLAGKERRSRAAGENADAAQQLEAILQRLQVLEEQARSVAPSLQEQVARAVEANLSVLRADLDERIRPLQDEIARVHRRLVALIAIALVGLAALWFAA